jgi:hypothetical protein
MHITIKNQSTQTDKATTTTGPSRPPTSMNAQAGFPGIVRNEPFVSGPPSPPRHEIPSVYRQNPHFQKLELHPTKSGLIDATTLSVITQDRPQYATDCNHIWTWDMRHRAQPILDFLWLGPHSVARDLSFMDREKFTMVLMVRDKKLADFGYMGLKRLSEKTDTVVDSVDVSSQTPLSSVFGSAVEKINSHLLGRHAGRCEYVIVDGKKYPGKVLVCCETGNDRSAVIVAAYLMKVYSASFIEAAQFVSLTRFCASFNDDTRNMLKAWEESLVAQSQVYQENALYEGAVPAGGAKRGFSETMDEDDMNMADDLGNGQLDLDRFAGRFVTPFTDGLAGMGGMDDSMQRDG